MNRQKEKEKRKERERMNDQRKTEVPIKVEKYEKRKILEW